MEFQTNPGEVILMAEETVLWNHTLSFTVPSSSVTLTWHWLLLAHPGTVWLEAEAIVAVECSCGRVWPTSHRLWTFNKYLEQRCLLSHKQPQCVSFYNPRHSPFGLYNFLVPNKVGNVIRWGQPPALSLWSLKERTTIYEYKAGDCWPGSYR